MSWKKIVLLVLLLLAPAWAGPIPFEEQIGEEPTPVFEFAPAVKPQQESFKFFHQAPRPTFPTANMQTRWGYGPAENWYNGLIVRSVSEHWVDQQNPLPPLLFKAVIATESAFKASAVSRTGAAGLTQLTPGTARRFGVSLGPTDERMIPEIAVPAGVKVLAEKHRVILEPHNYYGILLGRPEKRCPYGDEVARAYKKFGIPHPDSLFRLELAAYNGGGGTIMRAMARAHQQGLNPTDWDSLVGTQASGSPLYYACKQVYGGGASGKYREIADYPEKIFSLYYQR